ncbi:MAG: alanine--glyoxylate aminotransferase family protein [Candidatus Omnitrophica bacterium]|nr:alanine--glyoxylate aminotransferase family protein [Candidatus Omnitrophota bacterium]
MKSKLLLTPGPSPVPKFIREVMSRQIIHHRTDEFREVLATVIQSLKEIFLTENPVLILASSGTGAMEAAVSNFFSSQDKVIVVEGGKFGQRWKEIATRYGLDVISYSIDWGNAPDPNYLRQLLESDSSIKGILTTLCETSTGTVYDIESIGNLTRDREVILVVDAISGLGQDKLLTDKWGVDVVVAGSQKGLMLPPGLSFISISKKAEEFLQRSNLPKYYFDLKLALKSYQKNDTPFTPAVSLILGLEASLNFIRKEGIYNRWEKFSKLAKATQEALKAMGLKLFSFRPSNSVTAIWAPPSIKSSQLVSKLRKEYGISIAGGQAEFKDKIFRIAHMGAIEEGDLVIGFYFLERALKELGYNLKLGSSIVKLEEVLYA